MWSERETRATQYLVVIYSADKISGLDSLYMNLEILCIISGLGDQIGLARSDTTSLTLKQTFKGKRNLTILTACLADSQVLKSESCY